MEKNVCHREECGNVENSWQDKQPFVGRFSGVVLEGEKGTDKLDLLCLGALAV